MIDENQPSVLGIAEILKRPVRIGDQAVESSLERPHFFIMVKLIFGNSDVFFRFLLLAQGNRNPELERSGVQPVSPLDGGRNHVEPQKLGQAVSGDFTLPFIVKLSPQTGRPFPNGRGLHVSLAQKKSFFDLVTPSPMLSLLIILTFFRKLSHWGRAASSSSLNWA